MLQAGFHVHDDHIVLAIGQGGQDALEHDMLGADTAGAAHVHGAHDQQLDAVDVTGEGVGDVGNVGVELEELIGGVGAGALFHQGTHFGDGDDLVHFLLGKAQSQTQIGVGIHVGGQNGPAFVGVEPCQGGGQGGLTHAALTGNRYFHWKKTSYYLSNSNCNTNAAEFMKNGAPKGALSHEQS